MREYCLAQLEVMPTAKPDATVCRKHRLVSIAVQLPPPQLRESPALNGAWAAVQHAEGLDSSCWRWLLPRLSLCSATATALCCCTCRFATTYEGKYSDSIQQAYVYPSTNYLDDLAWGATWLYQLTNESQFLTVGSLRQAA